MIIDLFFMVECGTLFLKYVNIQLVFANVIIVDFIAIAKEAWWLLKLIFLSMPVSRLPLYLLLTTLKTVPKALVLGQISAA